MIIFMYVVFSVTSGISGFYFSHSKDINKRIEVHLVKKDWYPRDFEPPSHNEIIDEWDGSVPQAFKILDNRKLPGYISSSFHLVDAIKILTDPKYGYDPSLPSIIIMQTMFSGTDSFFSKNTIKGLAMRNMVKNYNVFNLRFPKLQFSIKRTVVESYLGLRGNYIIAGTAVASFFIDGINQGIMKPDQINLIGYSWSAQLAGYIARTITKQTKGKIKSILALDPYALGNWNRRVVHVSHTDADIVHLIHTNNFMWGSFNNLGTADFHFNNGNSQPGCWKMFTNIPLLISCSHGKAAQILWYVVLFKSRFIARSCPGFWKFWSCECENNPTVTLSYPLNETARGVYYLKTTEDYPFGVGTAGADCRQKIKNVKYPKL